MKFKKDRSREEKLNEVLDTKIKNLHPDFRKKLYVEYIANPITSNVVKTRQAIYDKYSFPELGSRTMEYWLSRGWSPEEAHVKSKQATGPKNGYSPYSREFWTNKVNPVTGINYTDEEADFERNSRRPIRKEYWIKQGYSPEDAEKKALETKRKNDKTGAKKAGSNPELSRYTSKRCKEYWIIRGSSEKEANKKVSERQSTFSLKKCIAKHGEIKGKEVWNARQEKWQKSFKKNNYSKVSQQLFWQIAERLPSLDGIYFAELTEDKNKETTGKNNERMIALDRVYKPDFIDINQKKIIEFQGSYWHTFTHAKKRDTLKTESYKNHGYTFLLVDEKEFYKNSEKVVQECLNFLKPQNENL